MGGNHPNMGHMAHDLSKHDLPKHDFSKNPMLVYWEMTQACGLACKHCRAEAMPNANPLELSTRIRARNS